MPLSKRNFYSLHSMKTPSTPHSPRCTLPMIFWEPTPFAIPAHRRSTSLIMLHLSAQAWLIIVIWAPGGGGEPNPHVWEDEKVQHLEEGRKQVYSQASVSMKFFLPNRLRATLSSTFSFTLSSETWCGNLLLREIVLFKYNNYMTFLNFKNRNQKLLGKDFQKVRLCLQMETFKHWLLGSVFTEYL